MSGFFQTASRKRNFATRAFCIGEQLGSQRQLIFSYPAGEAHVARYVQNETFVVCGNGVRLVSEDRNDELVPARRNPLSNPGALTQLEVGTFIIAGDDVELWLLTMQTRDFRKLAKLRLSGAV